MLFDYLFNLFLILYVEFMPRIVVISDQKIDYQGELKIVKVDTKFGNFENVFK